MNLLTAMIVAILFGSGMQLMVQKDAIKLATGTTLVSNAAILLLVSVGFGQHDVPILPIGRLTDVADPLVQALAVTAVVISFGTTVLLLRIALAVERSHDAIDMEKLVEAEIEESHEIRTSTKEEDAD